MKFTYPKELSYKSDLAVLNIIAAVAKEGWKRPLYFDAGLRQGDYAGTGDYMRLEGTVYRLMPYKMNDSSNKKQSNILGTVNTEKSYDLYMHFDWGGAERNDVYFDEPNRHELYSYRMQASSIANALVAEGKRDKAVMLLDKVMKGITEHSYYYDLTGYFIASAYYQAGALEKGQALSKKVVRNIENNLNWVSSLNEGPRSTVAFETTQQLRVMQSLGSTAYFAGDSTYAKTVMERLKVFEPKFRDVIQAANAGSDEQ
jgi:tetratricopeptide (TPR) repeat protein